MKTKLIGLGLVVCLVMAFCLPMCAPAPAPPEEELPPVEEELASFITAIEGAGSVEIAGDWAKFIEEKTGVAVRFESLSHGPSHAKIKAEAPHFSVDLGSNIGFPLMLEAKEKGWSVAYDSPTWRGAGDVWVDPDNYWWNQGNWAFVLVGNKDLLAEAGETMPESWEDLLDSKWKGKIIMPSPLTSGTAFMIVYTFMTLYGFNVDKGEEGGWEYLEALNKNVHSYTRGGNTPSDLVGRGEFMLGLCSDEMVLPRIREGYPLEWKVCEEGTGYGTGGAIILAGRDKTYTVKKIIDFMGTTEYLKWWSELAGYVTKDPAAVSALYGGIPKYVPNIDQGWAAENKDRLCEEWIDRIGRVPG